MSEIKISGWPEGEQFEQLRAQYREYVALMGQFSRTVQQIQKTFKSPKTREERTDRALTLLIEKHNLVGKALNEIKESWNG